MNTILDNDTGNAILSILFGLGLASIFRKVCRTNDCIIIKGPDPKFIERNIFRFNKKCYKYNSYATDCKNK